MSFIAKHFYEFGPFKIDLDERVLFKEGRPVPLPPKTFDTLAVLVERSGHIVEKDELMAKVWPDTFVEEGNLSRQVSDLRRVLGAEDEKQPYIETVPRRGYRFVAEVKSIPYQNEAADELVVETHSISRIITDEEVNNPVVLEARPDPAPIVNSTAATPIPSLVQHLIGEVKRHKLAVGFILMAALLVMAAVFFYPRRSLLLTEKDIILLADFDNRTGDAAFDETLRQAFAIQLEQSPFLNIFPEQRVRETLGFMGKSKDERVMGNLALEVCQRQGLKAMLTGSIASFGSHYVLTLTALNGQTGDTLARAQAEAVGKEQVLRRLGEAASQLREKLGESLLSIQQFDTPIEQATTSSLEAFKAFSLGFEQYRKGDEAGAVSFYQRAIEIDPQFALAYARLSLAYRFSGQSELMRQAAAQAFGLRGRVSEREKFEISLRYYDYVTGEMYKLIEVAEQFTRTYPNSATAYNMLGIGYLVTGRAEQAIEPLRTAIRLDPSFPIYHNTLGEAFTQLSRFAEAKDVIDKALAQKLDPGTYRRLLFEIAFATGDEAGVQKHLAEMRQRGGEHNALYLEGRMASFAGQLRQAGELYRRAITAAPSEALRGLKTQTAGHEALSHALCGDCRLLPAEPLEAPVIDRGKSGGLQSAALALAWCGKTAQAQSLLATMLERQPEGTATSIIWAPTIRAAIELQQGHYTEALELLRAVKPYESAALFLPTYVRAETYLRKGAAAEAEAEFQEILAHRGRGPISYLYPLAQLGLARAAALASDTVRSRKAYRDFFAFWKEADPDLPILIAAKNEAERL